MHPATFEAPDPSTEGLALPVDESPSQDRGETRREASAAGGVEVEVTAPGLREKVLLEIFEVVVAEVDPTPSDKPGSECLDVLDVIER
jgi:hypothetical protein